jgi:hypothetical protein
VLEVEVIGDGGPQAPARPEVERIVGIAFASAGVDAGHVAVEYVDADRIASLNREFRGRPGRPTCSPSRSTATARRPARASWATSSSARRTPRTCARPCCTARCT